jgi:hypothetical protein
LFLQHAEIPVSINPPAHGSDQNRAGSCSNSHLWDRCRSLPKKLVKALPTGRSWRFSSPRCRMTIKSCTPGIRRA